MTTVQKGTRDIKLGWLAFLENTAFSLYRLRRDSPTICNSETGKSLKSNIESMYTAEKTIEGLQSKLMATWGIKRNMLSKWMDLEHSDYEKRMSWRESTVSHSSNLQHGQTKKSRRK